MASPVYQTHETETQTHQSASYVYRDYEFVTVIGMPSSSPYQPVAFEDHNFKDDTTTLSDTDLNYMYVGKYS
jgi:hypothetical protein